MSKPLTLQDDFSQGMKPDFSPSEMPPGSVIGLKNYIPDRDFIFRRGGPQYASPDLSTVTAGIDTARDVLYAPFTTGEQLLAVGDNNGVEKRLFKVDSAVSATDKGQLWNTSPSGNGQSVFYRDRAIFCYSTAAINVRSYNGTTITDLSAGAPQGVLHMVVHQDRLILAGTAANPNRIYFSAPGDPTTWDTAVGFIDASFPVTGLASLGSALIVFTSRRVERIRGTTPPPGSDMVKETLIDFGVPFEGFTAYGDTVIFANRNGLFQTDGVSVRNITDAAGMAKRWQSDNMFSTTSGSIGVYNDWAICSSFTATPKCFVVHLPTDRFWEFSSTINMPREFTRDEAGGFLYAGSNSVPRVLWMDPVFLPLSALGNKADPDGTNFTSELITSAYLYDRGGPKVWKQVYVDYTLEDAASDNPTMTLARAPIETGVFANLADPTLAEGGAGRVRRRRSVNKTSQGMQLRIQSSSPSYNAKIHRIGADVHDLESGRLLT